MSQGFIYDQYGNHASKHQDGGVDEISVTGLPGLLADDQHALDAEVLAVAVEKALVTTAGDLIYATAAATLARLGITANMKLFGNAGGTAPEWKSGFKMITFTRDLTAVGGNVAYTGVGFKPSALIAIGGIDESVTASWGVSDPNGSMGCVGSNYGGIPGYYDILGEIILLWTAGGTLQRARVASYDTDGFTLTWAKAGSPTGTATIYVLALR